MIIKTIGSILETIASKEVDVSEDLKKDEKLCSSIKEILDDQKEKK